MYEGGDEILNPNNELVACMNPFLAVTLTVVILYGIEYMNSKSRASELTETGRTIVPDCDKVAYVFTMLFL